MLPGWLGRCVRSLALTALRYIVIALDLSLVAPIYFYWLEPTTIAIGLRVEKRCSGFVYGSGL